MVAVLEHIIFAVIIAAEQQGAGRQFDHFFLMAHDDVQGFSPGPHPGPLLQDAAGDNAHGPAVAGFCHLAAQGERDGLMAEADADQFLFGPIGPADEFEQSFKGRILVADAFSAARGDVGVTFVDGIRQFALQDRIVCEFILVTDIQQHGRDHLGIVGVPGPETRQDAVALQDADLHERARLVQLAMRGLLENLRICFRPKADGVREGGRVRDRHLADPFGLIGADIDLAEIFGYRQPAS